MDDVEARPPAIVRGNPTQDLGRIPDQWKHLPRWDRDVVEQRRLRHRIVAGRIIEWHLPLARREEEDGSPGETPGGGRRREPLVAAAGRLAAGQGPIARTALRDRGPQVVSRPAGGGLGEIGRSRNADLAFWLQ